MFRSKKPCKTAIRILKVYDKVHMEPTIIAAPQHITQTTIDNIKEYPERYAYKVRITDGLISSPEIKITDLNTPEHLPEQDVNVICEVTYTYTTKTPLPALGPLFKMFIVLTVISFLGMFGMNFWLGEQSKQERIDSQCYYYMKHGTPTSITLEGEEYKLKPNGSLAFESRVFMNPWHEEMLRSMTDNDCIVINTK